MLSEHEHKAIRLAGEIYTLMADNVVDHGPNRKADLAELALHVHNIQHMIMAQAAARYFPYQYRLLGKNVEQR